MDGEKISIFNSNIIKWYPFYKKETIIQIGENEEITTELNKKFKVVKVCNDIKGLTDEKKYEYILIYGYENFDEDLIKDASKILDENGKILLISRNFFGINNWSKYNPNENSGVAYLEREHKGIISIERIKEILKRNGLCQTNTFYIFPNYREAELIINENFNLHQSQLEKYNPKIEEDEIKLFDEVKLLKNIIKYDHKILDFFANSYFIEASKKKIITNVKYVSYNNYRKEKYQLITLIEDEVVKKIPANQKAKQHIEKMKKIINSIKEDGIDILDYEKNGEIYSKLENNQETLDNLFAQKCNEFDYIVDILNKMKEQLIARTISYDECKDYIYLKEEGEELLKDLHFMKNGYWDMIAKNCFYINDKFVFFDQEWEKEYLPAEFILYRSIINSYDLVRKINIDELLEKLNIIKYKQYFENIDKSLRKEIIDEKFYQEIYVKDIKSIDNLFNDNKEYKRLLSEIREDNNKKQAYIENLEETNKLYEEKIRKIKKIFFWKR